MQNYPVSLNDNDSKLPYLVENGMTRMKADRSNGYGTVLDDIVEFFVEEVQDTIKSFIFIE